MEIIDAHCHIGYGAVKKQTPEDLLRKMDENLVDRAIVVPVEESISVYNEEGNDYILQKTKQYSRLIGFAVANPWYGKTACALLDRYLGEGLRGVKFNPGVQGFHTNDEIVFPLIEIAAKYKVPVYFHSGTSITCMPFQLYDLAKRYPDVNFILGHSGWSDYWQDIPFIASHSTNIWFDTSLSYTSRTEAIIEGCGYDRVVFGSDSPHSKLKFELEKVRQLQSDTDQLNAILSGNISKLLEV